MFLPRGLHHVKLLHRVDASEELLVTLIIVRTTAEMGRIAARIIADAVDEKPDSVLGLATGSTPIRVYHELARHHKYDGLDLSRVRTFNLDEYLGISQEHSLSYRYFMEKHFFCHVNIPERNIHILDGSAENPEAECWRFEAAIRNNGGLDIQLLGIGVNGHIGFNEPGTPFASLTHVATLSAETVAQNSDGRFFKDKSEVPTRAFTMGMATIMAAKKVILVASGPRKARAIVESVEGPVTNKVPASLLQRHPNMTWIVEEEAAIRLTRRHRIT